MRKRRKVLATVGVLALALVGRGVRRRRRRRRAAATPTAASSEAPTHRRRRRRPRRRTTDRGDRRRRAADTAAPDTTDGRRAAAWRRSSATPRIQVTLQLQWFIQAQFAGYFAAHRPGLLRGPVPRRRRSPRAASTSCRSRCSPTARPTSPSPGCRRRCRRASRAPTSSTSPRSSSARARCRCRSRTPASPRRPTSPARTSATGASATSTRSSPPSARPASTRPPTSSSCSSSSTCSRLLAGDIDAAEAMTYNEYAQVLEAENPDTGELYTPEDFNVVSYEDVGVGMLQDAIWADAAKLETDAGVPRHRRALRRRLDPGLGVLPRQPRVVPRHRRRRRLAARRQPPAVADERGQQAHLAGRRRHRRDRRGRRGTAPSRSPRPRRTSRARPCSPRRRPTGAYTNEIVEAAIALLGDSVDTTGDGFEPIEVTLEEGGA